MRATEAWDFHHPTRIMFGPGRLQEIGGVAPGRTLVVTTAGATRRGLTKKVVNAIGPKRVIVHDRVERNPSFDQLDRGIASIRGEAIDTIVAVGGGSAIDTGKVLGLALAARTFASRDLITEADSGLDVEPIPLVAVPTTAGTGAEVTPFATVWDAAERRKYSIAGVRLHPSVALIDPELALDLPWSATLGPGIDALVQCLEAIWNRRATPITSLLAERGIGLAPQALAALQADPTSIVARGDLAQAALFSGIAISQTRTALAHSMSYPITAHHGLPHGLACGLVAPAVLEFNLDADDGSLAAILERATGAADPVTWMLGWYRELGVADAVHHHLRDLSTLESHVGEMLTPGRAGNNVRAADVDDIRSILRRTAELIDCIGPST